MVKTLLISAATSSREILAEQLLQNGFQVSATDKAGKGLHLLRANRLDLVIVDHKLAGLDSAALCVLIREDEALNHMAVVMLTDAEHEAEMPALLDCGADEYILRQASLSLVVSRLKAIVRRTSRKRVEFPNPRRVFESGRLRVDTVGRYVHVGAQEIKLSHKEYELLAEFIRNPGVALSRDFLISKVWGNAEMGNSRTLDVHVRWLREKIEVDPSKPRCIETIRSVGYRFNHG